MITRRTLLHRIAAAAAFGGAASLSGAVLSKEAETLAAAGFQSVGSLRILVAFYSRRGENYWPGGTKVLEVGNTERIAGFIEKLAGAKTFRIDTAKPYPAGYRDTTVVAKEEQAADARPAMKEEPPSMADYDVVFIGSPIWWGDAPMVIRTFLEKANLKGKIVVPFTTHGGSGLGRVPSTIERMAPEATVLPGLAVRGDEAEGAEGEVRAWLQRLGFAVKG